MRILLPVIGIAAVVVIALLTFTGGEEGTDTPTRPNSPAEPGIAPPDTTGDPEVPPPEGMDEGASGEDQAAPPGPGTSLRVRVVGPDKSPVAGASLRLLDRSLYTVGGWTGPDRSQFLMGIEVLDKGADLPGEVGTTDADGAYLFEDLEPGKYYLDAAAPGMATSDVPEIEVKEGAEASAELTLSPGAVISGHVVDTRKRPVANARILGGDWRRLTRVPYSPMGITTSKADGSFRLEGLSAGSSAALFARAPDGRIGLGIRVDAPTEEAEIIVGPRFAVYGTVVDDLTGAPIPGATLFALLGHAETDENGRYRIEGVVKSTFFRYVWIEKKGYKEVGHQIDLGSAIFGGREIEQDFRLEPLRPGRLVVSVKGVDGLPVAGTVLILKEWAKQDGEALARGVTGPDGEAVFEDLQPLSLSVEALKPGHMQVNLLQRRGGERVALSQDRQNVSIKAGGEVRIELVVARTGEGAGIVRDPEGHPLSGVQVRTNSELIAETGADGTFSVPEAPVEVPLRLHFIKEGYVTSREPLTVGGAPMEVVMSPGVTIAGKVVDADGRPVPGARISLQGERAWQDLVTGADGSFEFPDVEGEDYQLYVTKAGFAQRRFEVSALRPGESRTGLVLKLSEGIALRLFPVGPDGKPAHSAVILWGPASEPDERKAYLREDTDEGVAKFRVVPGTYQVIVAPYPVAKDAGALQIERPFSTAEDVRVALPGDPKRITVRFSGVEARRASVSVVRTAPEVPAFFVWAGFREPQEEGVLASPALLPGTYRLFFYYPGKDGNTWEHKTIENVKPGEEIRVEAD